MTFVHADAGRPEREWLASDLLVTGEVGPPAAGDHVLVVAAHPDDETLGAGGLIAAAHAAGARVSVVVASDGEASHPLSPTHDRAALARRRRSEVELAVRTLAPHATLHRLSLPDGRLAEHVDELAARLGEFRDVTLVVCPWQGDAHSDHAACARAVQLAAPRIACWQYPIWAWHWGDPSDGALRWQHVRRLPLGPRELAAKAAAIACHESQHAPLSDRVGDEALLHEGMLAHFRRGFETFVVSDAADASRAAFFDDLYASADDPWGIEERFYERRKRAALLAALPRERFRRAFEPGCATGVLTEQLAGRCDEVLAWDVASAAVRQARARTASSAHVHVEQRALPVERPGGEFDLIVVSEVGYYCADLGALERAVLDALAEDGCLVACHWRHPAPGHPHGGDSVHRVLGRRLVNTVSHVEADFLLDVWTRTGRSVAAETGVL